MIIPLTFVMALALVVVWTSRPIIATITALQLFFVMHVATTVFNLRDAMIAADIPADVAFSQALRVSVSKALYVTIILGLIMAMVHVVKRIFGIRKQAEAKSANPDESF